jgi:3-isopropylmalate dehydratase small subunit
VLKEVTVFSNNNSNNNLLPKNNNNNNNNKRFQENKGNKSDKAQIDVKMSK